MCMYIMALYAASKLRHVVRMRIRDMTDLSLVCVYIYIRLSFQTFNSKHAKDDGGQILSFRFAY